MGFFSKIPSRSQNIFIESAGLLKKLNFPRICLPIIAVLSAIINFAIIFPIFLIFLIITGDFYFISVVEMIPLLIIEVMFALGLRVALGLLMFFPRCWAICCCTAEILVLVYPYRLRVECIACVGAGYIKI